MKNMGTRNARLVLFAVGALAAPATTLAEDPRIELEVISDGGSFKLQFQNSECHDRPDEKGCIEAKHGSAPMLMWELESASNHYWMLTGLQFSVDGEHWGDAGFPLAECTMKAFALDEPDRYSGTASSAMVTGNGRMLQIRDRNEEVCRTHYRIYAMPRVGGAAIDSDPLIDNRGGAMP